MNRNTLIEAWSAAEAAGSLVTAKHDPTGLAITWDRPRSVLIPALADNFSGFLASGKCDINVYADTMYPHGSGYIEVIPQTGCGFSVVGSGVESGSLTPTSALDRLVFVHGPVQKWHVYAESGKFISDSVASGRLTLQANY